MQGKHILPPAEARQRLFKINFRQVVKNIFVYSLFIRFDKMFSQSYTVCMTWNEKSYNQSYYLIHKQRIREQHRRWYLANRDYAVKKQAVYNRKKRIAQKAARRSLRPLRGKVLPVLIPEQSDTRDSAAVSRDTIPDTKQYDLPVPVVPPLRTRKGSKGSRNIPAQTTDMVSTTVQSETIKESIPDLNERSVDANKRSGFTDPSFQLYPESKRFARTPGRSNRKETKPPSAQES